MIGSSSTTFTWMSRKVDASLSTSLQIVMEKNVITKSGLKVEYNVFYSMLVLITVLWEDI